MKRADATLAHDPTAGAEHHRPDDRFIPIRACDLVALLAHDATRFGFTPAEVESVASALHDVIVQEAVCFQTELADTYAAFNPDRDTIPLDDLTRLRTPEAYEQLHARLAYLLEKANFRKLSNVQVDAAIRTAQAYGLRIRLHPERVTQLEVWVRGRGVEQRNRRTWRKPLKGEEFDVSVYRRLAVIARLRDDPHVIVKLFKDIPELDVDALLPHAEVSMDWRDRLLVFGGGAGALGSSAGKLMGLFTGVVALSQLLWVLLVGFATLTFKTFMGYRRAQNNRDSQRTRHLYFQNIGNNASALQALVAIVTQEEFKEALLAYVFCHDVSDRTTAEADLDRRVEAYLKEQLSIPLDFDARDAFESLARLNLVGDREQLSVLSVTEAVEQLRAHWLTRSSAQYHEQCANRTGDPV